MFPQVNGQNQILYRALEAFFRHQRLFWIATIGISSLVFLALYMRNKSYVASASTQVVSQQEVASVLGYTKQSYVTPAQQNVSRFNDLLRDDEPGGFLDSTLKKANLNRPINVDPRARDARFDELRKKLSVQVSSADVFTLNLTWNDPAECERILRAMQAGYIEESGVSRQAQSIATANFLDTQIKAYKHRMRVAEEALIDYKRNHFGQLPEAQTAEIEQLGTLKAQRDYLKIASKDAILQRKAIEERLHQIKPTSILEEISQNAPKVESPTESGLRQLETRRSDLITGGYRSDSTFVRQVDGQIQVMRSRLAQERQRERIAAMNEARQNGGKSNVTSTTTQENPEYVSLMEQLTQTKIDQTTNDARLKLLNEHIEDYEERVQKLPVAARQLTDKTRDYSIMKEQYEDLLKRRESAQIKASLDKVAATSTLQAIGSVYAIATLGNGKMVLITVGSILFSMVVGAGLVLLAELLDPSLRYESDIERLLGVRVLTALPQISTTRTDRQSGFPRIGSNGSHPRIEGNGAAPPLAGMNS